MVKKYIALDEIKSNELEVNSKTNSSLKRIGNFIKEARISRNQSVEDLASDLKIGAHQLQAIEEGNEDLLPEKVFIRAMVRRISEKLKIDTEFIMSEFKTERKEVKVEEIVQEVSIKTKQNRSIKNQTSIGFIVFILISGILGLLASSQILNIFSKYFQNQISNQENIKKN